MGESGIGTPANPPSRGAQMPTAETTRSVAISPREVCTPAIRPRSTLKPVTLTWPWKDAPFLSASRAIASAGRVACVWMSDGTYMAPSTRSDSRGNTLRASAGLSRWASTPQLSPYPTFRFRSARRSGVQATSRLPTVLAQGTPSSSISVHRSRVYRAKLVMVLEALIWKTSPGAWDVEPPVSNSGPWSTTTTSRQPSCVR